MDPESKLFYRKLTDFGPGVGFREGLRKFEEEKKQNFVMNGEIGLR